MAIKQGYRGWATFSPTLTPIRVLCRVPGPRLSMPRNLDKPYPASNQANGFINFADGLRFPTVDLPLAVFSSWFTAVNLNAWFATRASDDLAVIGNGGIDFADSDDAAGVGRYRVMLPKGARFRIRSSQGEPISFVGTWQGTDLDPANPAAAPASTLTNTPLMFNAASFGGALANTKITAYDFLYDTGLTPNPELNSTLRPTEQNAGMVTGQLSLSTNGGVPLADNATGTITIGGVVFTFTKVICLNPDDREQQAGRVIRSFQYDCFGSTSADPIVIT